MGREPETRHSRWANEALIPSVCFSFRVKDGGIIWSNRRNKEWETDPGEECNSATSVLNKRKHNNNWPRIVSVTSQELWPTSLETLKVYSPRSLLSVLLILRTELLSVLWTLYRWPEVSSLPAFIHVALRGFVPEKRASRVAGSPWVTLMDLASSVIFAGSEILNKQLGSEEDSSRTSSSGASWLLSLPELSYYTRRKNMFLLNNLKTLLHISQRFWRCQTPLAWIWFPPNVTQIWFFLNATSFWTRMDSTCLTLINRGEKTTHFKQSSPSTAE